MHARISMEGMRTERLAATLGSVGRAIFALAIAALGVENLVCARTASQTLGPQHNVIPVLPWLPAIPWLAYLFGAVWIGCAAGLLFARTVKWSAMAIGGLLFICALVLDVPKYAAELGNMGLRTTALEPLSLATLAWLLPGPHVTWRLLERIGRCLLGLALVVFGMDHFLALGFIASLIPRWIPWHVFWVGFFGVVFIAGGVSIGVNLLSRWGAFGTGLMLGIWVVTLHLPRVLGLYGIPGAPHNPDEWSSLFIALGLWGGLWAIVPCFTNTKGHWPPDAVLP